MKIALIGTGKMGKMVEACAEKRGDEVVARIGKGGDYSQVSKADVCIDFSVGAAVMGTLEAIAPYKKPIVIGTTGWEVERAWTYSGEMGILYAPNCSVGVALFGKLLAEAGRLLSDRYDVSGVETHHKEKRDIPSGTALHLAKLAKGLKFESVRSGHHVGTHQVVFDAEEDTIELTHRARSRAGFAEGALDMAGWLIGKVGFFTMDDFIRGQVACTEPLQR